MEVEERVVVSLAPSSLLLPQPLLPFVALEFYLKFCQCQCEAGEEAILSGVRTALGLFLASFFDAGYILLLYIKISGYDCIVMTTVIFEE